METKMADPFKDTDFIRRNVTISFSLDSIRDSEDYYYGAIYISIYNDADYSNELQYLSFYGGSDWDLELNLETPGIYMSSLYLELALDFPDDNRTFLRLGKVAEITGQNDVKNLGAVKYIHLSGRATDNGEVVLLQNEAMSARTTIYAFLEPDFSGPIISKTQFRNDSWNMAIPGFDDYTEIYFLVEGVLFGNIEYIGKGSVFVKDYSPAVIEIDICSISAVMANTITLSGTAAVTIDGSQVSRLDSVIIYSDPYGIIEIGRFRFLGNINVWEIEIPAWENAGKTLYFSVAAYDGGFYLQKNNVHIKNTDIQIRESQNISGINLMGNITSVTLSGKVLVLADDLPVQEGFWVDLRPDPKQGSYVSTGWVKPGETTWTIKLSDDIQTPLYFAVDLWFLSEYLDIGKNIIVNGNMSGIDLGVINISTIGN